MSDFNSLWSERKIKTTDKNLNAAMPDFHIHDAKFYYAMGVNHFLDLFFNESEEIQSLIIKKHLEFTKELYKPKPETE